jgi:hypothetical protein
MTNETGSSEGWRRVRPTVGTKQWAILSLLTRSRTANRLVDRAELEAHGGYEATRRVRELKKMGWDIRHEFRGDGTRTVYWLADDEPTPPTDNPTLF